MTTGRLRVWVLRFPLSLPAARLWVTGSGPGRLGREKGELRVKLENGIEKAKEVCDSLQDQTAAAAKAADKAIREHPYQAIGVALGVGVLLGVLAMWSRRASGPLPEHGLRPGPGD